MAPLKRPQHLQYLCQFPYMVKIYYIFMKTYQ